MNLEAVVYEKSEHIVTITLNRPERMNSLSQSMARDLRQSWQAFKDDADAWIAIVTGAGERAFCAGLDLKDAVGRYDRGEEGAEGISGFKPSSHGVYKPIIAAVNGHAVGGGLDLVLESDIVVCSENATFSDPHVSTVGWPAPAAATLPRLVPWTIAMRLLLMGLRERMDARRAYEIGLVTEVVPLPRLLARAREIASTVLDNSPMALWGTKEVAVKSLLASLEGAEAALRKHIGFNKGTNDAKEGARAFIEKRKPKWTLT